MVENEGWVKGCGLEFLGLRIVDIFFVVFNWGDFCKCF